VLILFTDQDELLATEKYQNYPRYSVKIIVRLIENNLNVEAASTQASLQRRI
jgi:hypothetical protein